MEARNMEIDEIKDAIKLGNTRMLHDKFSRSELRNYVTFF
jgi:hypothetical protein